MSLTSLRRPVLLALLAPLLAGLTTLPALPATALGTASQAIAAPDHPRVIQLPDGFQPEGIAIRRSPFAYFGSRVDGDIYRASLRTGRGSVITQGPGTQSLGMKIDRRGRLFVAGGDGGDGRVIDTRTGRVLRSYDFARTNTFVNDVVLSRGVAWFTDSLRPRLYGVPLGRHGRLPRQAEVVTLPLRGDWNQVPEELNANGIARTPDGRALLVVQSSTGYLFRVHPGTGAARRVDLGDTLLTNGDGLLNQGRILYAVQNRLNQVAVLRLSPNGRSGRLVDTLRSSRFDVPTTVARYGNSLYLPNARFTTPPTPTTEYTANRVRLPAALR
jgi:sugar lactone lactonase YvrE